MQYPSTSRAQSQGFVQPNTSVRTGKAYIPLASRAASWPEACMGTGRLRFSIPDTTLLRRKCPDACLQTSKMSSKTDWVARPQAREGKVLLPAVQHCADNFLLALGTP